MTLHFLNPVLHGLPRAGGQLWSTLYVSHYFGTKLLSLTDSFSQYQHWSFVLMLRPSETLLCHGQRHNKYKSDVRQDHSLVLVENSKCTPGQSFYSICLIFVHNPSPPPKKNGPIFFHFNIFIAESYLTQQCF